MTDAHRSSPNLPPVADADAGVEFAAVPEVRIARNMYEEAVQSLRALASQAVQTEPDGDTRQLAQDIAILLHNLSGTAAHFGEAGFGQQARALEQPVRYAFTAAWLQPYCHAILAGIDRR